MGEIGTAFSQFWVRGNIKFRFLPRGQNKTGETCQPAGWYPYGLPRACQPQAGIVGLRNFLLGSFNYL
ncbi:hypothetical protein DHD80_16820 [Gramella sp. AN32]|nr:hypothetical protein [Gramella sp. AN32]